MWGTIGEGGVHSAGLGSVVVVVTVCRWSLIRGRLFQYFVETDWNCASESMVMNFVWCHFGVAAC